jgi:hypothetical protein
MIPCEWDARPDSENQVGQQSASAIVMGLPVKVKGIKGKIDNSYNTLINSRAITRQGNEFRSG